MPLRTALVAAIAAFFLLGASDPGVNLLLFINPGCRPCHEVASGVIADLSAQHGRRLSVVIVDVTQEPGRSVYAAAIKKYGLAPEDAVVPMTIAGGVVLAGRPNIEGKLPALIEQKLAEGGVDWPDIPGLQALLEANGVVAAPAAGEPTVWTSFMADQPGNSLAVIVLVFLAVSLMYSILTAFYRIPNLFDRFPAWTFPLLILLGLVVSLYLSYTELTASEVACGGFSHCDAVQASDYSKIFGFIPMGLFGVAGNLALAVTWIAQRMTKGWLRDAAAIACFGCGVFGVSFSIYLTFLEPFVIGATCLYCLTSAVVMALLLPLTITPLRQVIRENVSNAAAARP